MPKSTSSCPPGTTTATNRAGRGSQRCCSTTARVFAPLLPCLGARAGGLGISEIRAWTQRGYRLKRTEPAAIPVRACAPRIGEPLEGTWEAAKKRWGATIARRRKFATRLVTRQPCRRQGCAKAGQPKRTGNWPFVKVRQLRTVGGGPVRRETTCVSSLVAYRWSAAT